MPCFYISKRILHVYRLEVRMPDNNLPRKNCFKFFDQGFRKFFQHFPRQKSCKSENPLLWAFTIRCPFRCAITIFHSNSPSLSLSLSLFLFPTIYAAFCVSIVHLGRYVTEQYCQQDMLRSSYLTSWHVGELRLTLIVFVYKRLLSVVVFH